MGGKLKRLTKDEKKKKKKKKLPPPSAYAKVFYDISHPAGFGSITSLMKAVPGSTRASTIDWLAGEDAYTLHRPARRRFKHDQIFVQGIDDQFATDLIDLQSLASENKGYKYLMTVVDTLSKYAWVTPLKDKKSSTVAAALDDIFERGRVPRKLRSDRGKEYLGRPTQAVLEKRNIIFFTADNYTKEAVIERFNRTLRSKMWKYFQATNTVRYIDVLPAMVRAYNARVHRTTGMAPEDVTPYNAHIVWNRMYGHLLNDKKTRRVVKPRFKVGDLVRLSKSKGQFEQGYKSTYTRELFIVHRVITSGRHTRYKIRDRQGDIIQGTFQAEELLKVREQNKQVSKTIKTLKDHKIVTWRGHPPQLRIKVAR